MNENNRNPNIFGLHQRDLSDDRKKSFVRACQKSVLFIYEEKGDDAPHVIRTLVFLTDTHLLSRDFVLEKKRIVI